jgi:hypothetical protein
MEQLLHRAQVRVHRDPRAVISELRQVRANVWHEPAEDELWPKIDTALRIDDYRALYTALDLLAAVLARHHREAADLAIEARNAVEYILKRAARS